MQGRSPTALRPSRSSAARTPLVSRTKLEREPCSPCGCRWGCRTPSCSTGAPASRAASRGGEPESAVEADLPGGTTLAPPEESRSIARWTSPAAGTRRGGVRATTSGETVRFPDPSAEATVLEGPLGCCTTSSAVRRPEAVRQRHRPATSFHQNPARVGYGRPGLIGLRGRLGTAGLELDA